MSNNYIKKIDHESARNALLSKNMHTGAWLLVLIISVLFSFSAGIFLIWMSIDRTDLAYNIHRVQKDLGNGQGHIVKLEVERDSLLSPYELDKKARELGLSIADPGQVRRLMN